MKEPCITVGLTATPGDGGHIKPSMIYTFTWLPKGYGPSMEDRTVCVLFDPSNELKSPLRDGERHPIIDAVATAIETYMRQHPELSNGPKGIGFLKNI